MEGAHRKKSPPGLEELDEELSVGELNLLINSSTVWGVCRGSRWVNHITVERG